MAEEYAVSVVPDEEPGGASALGVVGVIWNELSGGIGPWGTLRPLVALALSLVPFLFLGQHFNRQHSKGFGWFVSGSLARPLRLVHCGRLVGFQRHCR